MKATIDFDLPFEDCSTCLSLDPCVKRSDYRLDEKLKIHCNTRFYCKGETFCIARANGFKEEENE